MLRSETRDLKIITDCSKCGHSETYIDGRLMSISSCLNGFNSFVRNISIPDLPINGVIEKRKQ